MATSTTVAGIIRLWRHGCVEPIVAPPLPAHLAAHELLALALQKGAVAARLGPEWLGRPLALGEDVARSDDAGADHLTGHPADEAALATDESHLPTA